MGALLIVAGVGGLIWFFYSASQSEPDVCICCLSTCTSPSATGVIMNNASALSAVQIAQFARTAGFTDDLLPTAVAICFAESGGIPSKYNPELKAKPPTPANLGSYGLWQIYLFKHPEFTGWNLYDPQTNANAAIQVYNQRGNFTAWATFTTSNPVLSYSNFMTVGNDALAQLNASNPTSDSPVATSADESPTACPCNEVNFGTAPSGVLGSE